jgi:hypothetical protein
LLCTVGCSYCVGLRCVVVGVSFFVWVFVI